MPIELSSDDIETLKDVFNGYGCDCPDGDTNKIQALAERLGIWKSIEPLTEDQLKRNEEFRNSAFGKQISEMFTLSNKYIRELSLNIIKPTYSFTAGPQWLDKFDNKDTLKIKLPNDFIIIDKKVLNENDDKTKE